MPLTHGSSRATVSHNIAEMVAAGHPQDQAVAAALRVARQRKADGGEVGAADSNGQRVKLHTGPIHSPVAGRTDHLPMHVPSGSYVIPADIISAMGEGNTVAGFKAAKSIFSQPLYAEHRPGGASPYAESQAPYGQPMPEKSAGGEVTHAVPIVAAGGEYVIHPRDVTHLGKGSLDNGHKALDEFVKRMRAETVKTLRNLPGPKKD